MSEHKSKTASLLDSLKSVIPDAVKKYAPIFIAKVVSKSSKLYGAAVWAFFAVFKYLWKKAEPWFEQTMFYWDALKLDKEKLKEYSEMKKQGASSEELKKKRHDLLNTKSKS